jgi:hypothetical protein
MMFEPHRKHTYVPPRPVTGIALLFVSVRKKEDDVSREVGGKIGDAV